MASSAKKRKKNPPSTPHKGKTLDHFFNKKPPSKVPSVPDTNVSEFDDERYARGLAKLWSEEDRHGATTDVNGGAGCKRRRSSNSQERRDSKLAKWMPLVEQEGQSSGLPVSLDTSRHTKHNPPSRNEVLFRAEEGIHKTIDSTPLDSDPLSFNPDDNQRLADDWPGGKATYGLLTRAFVLVNATRSRVKIVDTLVNLLRILIRLDPSSLLPAVWLATNDIGPPYENNELGIGSSIIAKAITKTSGISPTTLKKLYNKYGDPGDVAFDARAKQKTLMMRKPTPLTILNVYTTLTTIASSSGKGSQKVKESHVKRLLVDAKGEEIRYLTRTFIQNLRIGAVKTTMLIALARAFSLSRPKDATWDCPEIPKEKEARQELFAGGEEVLKRCFARRPNYNDIVPALIRGGIRSVENDCGMALHCPLKPMLGSITRGLDEILVKLQERTFACEYKYDGQRAQIHCDESGRVSIFSRRLELMTSKYPDLVALVLKIRGEGVRSFILEGEVVAVDTATGELKPFQTLAGRERKNVEIGNISVSVCLFAFDLMYMNGQELLSHSFRFRREVLRTKFTEIPHQFTWAQSMDATSSDSSAVRKFFKSALSSRCEGIMVKVLDNAVMPIHPTLEDEEKASPSGKRPPKSRWKPLLATYEPDKRLESWLKVKKDYDSSSDTLDLIPIGGWHGQGRKSKWWSPILLAVRNPATGSLEAVCKCMSGFTDRFYSENKELYSEDGGNTGKTKKAYYESALTPAVWFEPKEVWEVAFADITLSPTYSAALGLVSDERGLSLRFPRFLRKREDKSIDEASTPEFLAELYWKQEQAGGTQHVSNALEQEPEEEDEGQEAGEKSNESGGEGNDDVADDATTEEDTSYEASQM